MRTPKKLRFDRGFSKFVFFKSHLSFWLSEFSKLRPVNIVSSDTFVKNQKKFCFLNKKKSSVLEVEVWNFRNKIILKSSIDVALQCFQHICSVWKKKLFFCFPFFRDLRQRQDERSFSFFKSLTYLLASTHIFCFSFFFFHLLLLFFVLLRCYFCTSSFSGWVFEIHAKKKRKILLFRWEWCFWLKKLQEKRNGRSTEKLLLCFFFFTSLSLN